MIRSTIMDGYYRAKIKSCCPTVSSVLDCTRILIEEGAIDTIYFETDFKVIDEKMVRDFLYQNFIFHNYDGEECCDAQVSLIPQLKTQK